MLVPNKALEIFEDGGSTADVIRAGITTIRGNQVSVRRVQEWRKAWKEGTAESYNEEELISTSTTIVEQGDKATVQVTTDRITTLDQLLKSCEINIDIWEIEKCEINKYEMGRKNTLKNLEFQDGKISGFLEDSGTLTIQPMISVKVWLKKRPTRVFEDVVEKAISRMREYAPHYQLHKYEDKNEPHLFVPQFYDAHFNNLAVDESHTSARIADEFKRASDIVISKANSFGLEIERILLPVGNDALQADNLHGTTTKGTQQELAGDQRNAVDYMFQSYVHLIEGLTTIGKVDVVVVSGNHDQFVDYFLGKYLDAWFHNNPNVEVDTDKNPRKYYRYGNTMICMEHGDKISPKDMAGIMATESPEYFASTKYREVWRGHLHTDKTLYYPLTEQYGVSIRYMPSLAKTNRWHLEHGYVENHRAVKGMFYNFWKGPAGIFPIFLD